MKIFFWTSITLNVVLFLANAYCFFFTSLSDEKKFPPPSMFSVWSSFDGRYGIETFGHNEVGFIDYLHVIPNILPLASWYVEGNAVYLQRIDGDCYQFDLDKDEFVKYYPSIRLVPEEESKNYEHIKISVEWKGGGAANGEEVVETYANGSVAVVLHNDDKKRYYREYTKYSPDSNSTLEYSFEWALRDDGPPYDTYREDGVALDRWSFDALENELELQFEDGKKFKRKLTARDRDNRRWEEY